MFFIKTTEQVFPHSCQPEDLKLTGYTPHSMRYHCIECGGMLTLPIGKDDWEHFFGPNSDLRLTESIIHQVSPSSIQGEIDNPPSVQAAPSKHQPHPKEQHLRWTPKKNSPEKEDVDNDDAWFEATEL